MQTFPPNQNAIARRGDITRPPDHERFAWSVVTLVAAAVLGIVDTLCAQDARSSWSRLAVDGEVIVTTRWPLPERCQAAATKTTLYIADASGSLLWQWPFRDTNRFIHVTQFSTIALSPDCQHAILAGNVDYRYVWAVDRDGRARVLRTVGTPLFAAFSLDGTTVAVVTGARRGYLLAPMLTVKWSGNTSHIPVRWPSQVGGVGGEGGATFSRAQVEQLLGALMWGWGVNDDVSDDGQWRAVTQQEPRGPGPGSVEFFGPHADGFHGRLLAKRPRWSHAVGCPSAEVSADGEFVIVMGDFKNPDNQQCETDTVTTKVFDREGAVVASLQIPHPTGTGYSPEERDELIAAVALAAGKPLRLKER